VTMPARILVPPMSTPMLIPTTDTLAAQGGA
jgi:hypothetical protein